ncbi:hypothetical protein, partial [Rhizobium leguminosarum]|uniref:hypothetical protein n=1 Tax=Rhizobium leguminosarum TaxID=384 RepID=UPI003F96C0A9
MSGTLLAKPAFCVETSKDRKRYKVQRQTIETRKRCKFMKNLVKSAGKTADVVQADIEKVLQTYE